ncbi:MAG: oxidoreductase [Candidimonas sp.]|nr:MAG: oxidoreductase [Candidimonas sp.]TAM20975.1 MAG: oxidoreductase [Candidimonas sp.]
MSTHEPTLKLNVAGKKEIANGIFEFELRDPASHVLPAFTPGSHISVRTPSGLINKYSLSNSPLETDRYVIAVKRDEQGRGGSVSMADALAPGAQLYVSLPENAFELTDKRTNYIFIAGGIGITPIFSMIQYLLGSGVDTFKLYYLTRNAQSAAYLNELNSPTLQAHVVIHHDEGNLNNSYDLWPVLENPRNSQIYCCGPRFLMEGVKDMTGHWPAGAVTFESFGTEAKQVKNNTAFAVTLQSNGKTIQVDEQTTILEALAKNGVIVPSSCESGTCGTCKTGLIAGDADHRDMVLDESERHCKIIVCVSRATSGNLILDL